MLAVCSLFGVYIKFSVHSTASMGTETVARPAVEVMRNAQRQLQMADNGLPFPVTGTTWTVEECMCE